MKENIPVKSIPLPDYGEYRQRIVDKYRIDLPLKALPALQPDDIPPPLATNRTGWPWTTGSEAGDFNEALPKITVVIPSYQQGLYIEEAIRSVLLQNYPSTELIIIDGGSNDSTIAVVEYYKNFISLFISEEDSGQSHAINKGFSMASGELYYWLNSDDYLVNDAFHKIVKIFLNSPALDIAYGDGYTYNEKKRMLRYDRAPIVFERYLRFGGIVLSHSLIWRSSAHCPIWEDLSCAMDAELWLRLFTGRKFTHVKFPIGTARVHPDQKTSNGAKWEIKWKRDYEELIWVWYPKVNNWPLRVYEYRIVQHIFRKYRNLKDWLFRTK